MGQPMLGKFVGTISAAADYMAPGAIEVNRYQAEILDLVRRRFYLGQRINQVPATGQPSRYFEQVAIPGSGWTDPRQIVAVPGQPVRVEKYVTLKAIVGAINYSMFDVEVNQQQGQFAYLEAKDLTDTIDSVLKTHDIGLWNGTDTDLIIPQTVQYVGIATQVIAAPPVATAPAGYEQVHDIPADGSLVDDVKTQVAVMVSREDFEVKPSGLYANPVTLDLFDREAKSLQMYYNETEILPGVIVKAIPTQAGLLPMIPDAGIRTAPAVAPATGRIHTFFVLSEEFVEYHWLTSPVPRVFQLGLLSNLAAQFVVIKFGAPVAKGAGYAHCALTTTR